MKNEGYAREHYGGPVKNKTYKYPLKDSYDQVLNRPENLIQSCLLTCDTYYLRCMYDYGNVDPQMCQTRYKEMCRSECVYSNKHRL